jgi:hypothetical protein
MGDRRRFREFAAFIDRTFPTAVTVADVAGGCGELAFRLHELGKRTVIIDPRDATFPRWVHRTLRKRAVRTGAFPHLERVHKDIEQVDLRGFDLIVALHPDEATEPALRAAVRHDVDFAIVPCCVFPCDGIKRSREEWVTYLAALAPGTHVATLPISGTNIVLWRKRDGPLGGQRADQ